MLQSAVFSAITVVAMPRIWRPVIPGFNLASCLRLGLTTRGGQGSIFAGALGLQLFLASNWSGVCAAGSKVAPQQRRDIVNETCCLRGNLSVGVFHNCLQQRHMYL